MNLMKYTLAAGLLSCATVSYAIEETVNADITQLLQLRLGNTTVVEAEKTPADGVYQTKFGSKIAYLTGNGRYIIMGDMIDLQTQVNLTEFSRREVTKAVIDAVAIDNLAVFPSAIDETKAVLNVFTDTSCGYCKKLHEEVPDLQKAGIEVRYFPFPRGGSRGPGYQDLKSVWCGKDKTRAMNIAKEIEKGELPSADCVQARFVDEGYDLGNQLGVTGTPALFTDEGEKIDGYVPAAQLIPRLLK